MSQNVKVQLPSRYPSDRVLLTRIPEVGEVFTFHAFSDAMKARVLELIASGQNVVVSLTDENPRTGEWFEKPIK